MDVYLLASAVTYRWPSDHNKHQIPSWKSENRRSNISMVVIRLPEEIMLNYLGKEHPFPHTYCILLSIVTADPASSTLYLNKTQTIFSINVANDSNDTYLYFESAYRHAWVEVTLSPRISTGSNEPRFSKDIRVEVLTDTGTDCKMAVGAICHNCRSWNRGSLDVLSIAQPWMYAFGSSGNLVTSDSPTAGLTQHTTYGKFTMHMTQAAVAGQLPNPTKQMSGVTVVGNQYIKNGDIVAPIHGRLMAALVIIFTPLLTLHLLSVVIFVCEWLPRHQTRGLEGTDLYRIWMLHRCRVPRHNPPDDYDQETDKNGAC
ncbi:hypothetical protein BDZ45DRAFT_808600 [Acephala macrosclerotiorum]|nr:hypothetical protein BDZ45DRAFT_808600 [Acephala macrosclerotiorum]